MIAFISVIVILHTAQVEDFLDPNGRISLIQEETASQQR